MEKKLLSMCSLGNHKCYSLGTINIYGKHFDKKARKEELITHLIKTFNNRLSGKIGLYVMDKYKSFQIDEEADLKICSAIIKEFQIDIR